VSAALVLRRDDRLACRAWIARHSKSFYLSSLLLPARVRQASWALYAFCRRADDAVDEQAAGGMARVEALRARLERVYAGRADDDPIDRAFAAVVERHAIPRALPEALLSGMEMDARGTRYADDDELLVYCFRVAATVGLMMTRVMGASDDVAYLRAADLGVAMQLTNIARDVGEDERRGRVYLPAALLDGVGGDRKAAVRALLARAEAHYRAADRGVPLLPRDCRFAIASARNIYSAIGTAIARNGYDSLSQRAYVSLPRKLWLVARALPARFSSGADAHQPGPADEELRALVRAVGLPA
jgi:15-cis-phytoene synthase